jgi:hypothetical protein
MASDPKLIQAARSLGSGLRGRAWLSSVGIGEEDGHPVLVLYLSKQLQAKAIKALPSQWQQLPVKVQHLGKLTPAGA